MVEKLVTKAELARRLQVKPQSVDYMLTRKSIDTDTLYNVSKALDYDFALLYSIDKEQMNYDRENEAYKLSTAKILIELELKPDEIIKLNLRKKISELLRKNIFFSINSKASDFFIRTLYVSSPNCRKNPAWTGIIHLLRHLVRPVRQWDLC